MLLTGVLLAVTGCAIESEPPSSPLGSGGAGTAGVGAGAGLGGSAGASAGATSGTSGSSGSAGALAGYAGSGGVAGSAGGGASGGLSGAGFAGSLGGAGAAATGGAGAAGSAGDATSGGTAGAPSGGNAGVGGVSGSSGGGGETSGGAGSGGVSGASGSGGAGASGYQPCPATGACKIMPFGDSITEGYPVFGGYRMELFRRARADDHTITFVGSVQNGPTMVDGVPFPRNHEGHGGYTIENEPARNANGIAPFVQPSMTSYTPHIVTLMIGTNDLNGNIDVADAPNRLGALLDSIHAVDPDVLIVLAQIVPTRNDGTNQVVRNYNSAMPALVSQRAGAGRHLILVDMYGAFTRDANYKNTLLGDNLHPNEAGYTRMAETWYAALEPYLR